MADKKLEWKWDREKAILAAAVRGPDDDVRGRVAKSLTTSVIRYFLGMESGPMVCHSPDMAMLQFFSRPVSGRCRDFMIRSTHFKGHIMEAFEVLIDMENRGEIEGFKDYLEELLKFKALPFTEDDFPGLFASPAVKKRGKNG